MESNWGKILHMLEQCLNNLHQYIVEAKFGTSINMGTYFTIILSVLMVYGIFLSFLQYAAKEYSSPLLYMGRDLYKENLFARNQNIWNLIDRKYVVSFGLLVVLPIMAQIALIGYKSKLWHNIFLIAWMGVSIFVVGIFAIVFIKCARALINLMNSNEEWLLKAEANAYNNRYMKRCQKKRKMNTDEFADRIRIICKYWNEDGKIEKEEYAYNYDSDYLNLINSLIFFYGKKREQYIARRNRDKNETAKMEVGIVYNLGLEMDVFDRVCEVTEKKDIELYEFMQFVLKRNKLLKSGMQIYVRHIEKYEVDYYVNRDVETLIREYFKIYEICHKKYKRHTDKMDVLIRNLRDDFLFYAQLGNDEIRKLAYRTANRIFEKNIAEAVEEKNERNLEAIYFEFGTCLETKRWFTNWLDCYVEDNSVDMELFESIINRMDQEVRVYILLHLFFYYSIYDFRFTWKYFDIKLLKCLVKDGKCLLEKMETGRDFLIEELKKPMNMWRFNIKMYNKLMEYMHQAMNMEHLEAVRDENEINYKYYFALRVVCWKECSGYQNYEIKNSEMQRELLTFISAHPEFFDDIDFRDFYEKLQSENYQKIELGEEMNSYTLEELINGDFRINKHWMKELIRENRGPLRSVYNYLVLSYASSYEYEYLEPWLKSKLPSYLGEYDGDKEMYISKLLEICERFKIWKNKSFETKLRELIL